MKARNSIDTILLYLLAVSSCWLLIIRGHKARNEWKCVAVQQQSPTTYYMVLERGDGIRLTNTFTGTAPFTK